MSLPFWFSLFKSLLLCLYTFKCFDLYLYQTHTLEEEAYPALDELTSQISTLNLERVRQIKSRLVALSGRVQKVYSHTLSDNCDWLWILNGNREMLANKLVNFEILQISKSILYQTHVKKSSFV